MMAQRAHSSRYLITLYNHINNTYGVETKDVQSNQGDIFTFTKLLQ